MWKNPVLYDSLIYEHHALTVMITGSKATRSPWKHKERDTTRNPQPSQLARSLPVERDESRAYYARLLKVDGTYSNGISPSSKDDEILRENDIVLHRKKSDICHCS
ncbi:hypothetical protein CBL_06836 [Carabus blaptoides fortunei]